MSIVYRLVAKFRIFWWQLRHEVYYYDVPVPPPISPGGGDDTANIQNAIDTASSTPEWFREIEAAYYQKWYRFLLRKPMLNATVRFGVGTYMIGTSLLLASNVEIRGEETQETQIRLNKEGRI